MVRAELKKRSFTPTPTTPRCCTALSRPSMALPEEEQHPPPPPPPPPPLTSADGSTIIKDKEGIWARWEEHFDQLLNRPSTVDQEAMQQILQKPLPEDLDLPPSVDEIKTTIKERKVEKLREQMEFLQDCTRQLVQQLSRHFTTSLCPFGRIVVCWLLNVPATCKCISGTDLLRQFYVLPHWDWSCKSNFPSHPVTVYWHRANQSQHWSYNTRRLVG